MRFTFGFFSINERYKHIFISKEIKIYKKMDFKEEIKKCIADNGGFSLQINACGGYFLGVKRILTLTGEKIEVETGDKKRISVTGEKLGLKKLDGGDLAFSGKVTCAEVKEL